MNFYFWLSICSSIMLIQRCTGQYDDDDDYDQYGHIGRKRNNRKRNNQKVLAIVGGRDSLPEIRTYQVSLQGPYHFCGGSIINSRYIFTAAHCLQGRKASDIKVLAGTLRLSQPYHTYEVSKIIPHENYDKDDSYRNDIGLLQLKKPISFDRRVKTIRLPKPTTKVNDGDIATVSGWGRLINSSKPDILQEVDLKIVNQEKCKKAVQKRKFSLYPTQLCAQDDDNTIRQGECNGDSGGPLVSKEIQIGIVSWSIKDPSCGSNEYPGVYTRVTEFLDWIKNNQQ